MQGTIRGLALVALALVLLTSAGSAGARPGGRSRECSDFGRHLRRSGRRTPFGGTVTFAGHHAQPVSGLHPGPREQ